MHLFDPLAPHHEVLAREGIAADASGRFVQQWLCLSMGRLLCEAAGQLRGRAICAALTAQGAPRQLGSLSHPTLKVVGADAPLLDIVFVHGMDPPLEQKILHADSP